MSASHSLDSRAKVSTWEKNYTKDYVSIGTAKAQVKYYFYNSKILLNIKMEHLKLLVQMKEQ